MSRIIVAKGPEAIAGSMLSFVKNHGRKRATTIATRIVAMKDSTRVTDKNGVCQIPYEIKPINKLNDIDILTPNFASLIKYFKKFNLLSRLSPRINMVCV